MEESNDGRDHNPARTWRALDSLMQYAETGGQEKRNQFLEFPDRYAHRPHKAVVMRARMADGYAFEARQWRNYDKTVEVEARNSAAIESVQEADDLIKHQIALDKFITKGASEAAMLEFHEGCMANHPESLPGQYRDCRVRVGNHVAPPSEQVPELMAGVFQYLRRRREHEAIKAARVHLVFETIHPFRDGNGRTGRALASAIIRSPLAVSREIMKDKQQYYHHLSYPEWNEWLEYWIGLMLKAGRTAEGRWN